MKGVVLALALLAGSASARLFTSSESAQKYMWEEYKTEHQKNYADSAEEASRFAVFVENLKIIDDRNAADDGATHGLNKFSDMSQDEFKRTFLNYVPRGFENRTYAEIAPLAPGATVNKDWTGTMTTPVKNQVLKYYDYDHRFNFFFLTIHFTK
jgi:hypothetical protein